MQKRYTFKIILSVSAVLFLGIISAQTPVLLAPGNAPVESGVLSEYSGRLGIGIAQPSFKLHIKDGGIGIEQDAGNSNASEIMFYRGDGSFQGRIGSGVDSEDSNFIVMSTNGTCINCEPAIFINGSDKVGVKNSTPVATLDVIGTGKFTGLVEAAKLTVTDGEFTTTSTDGFSFGGTDLIIKPLGLITSGSGNSIVSSSANSLVVGGNNTLSGTTPAHHLVVGSENEVSGKFGFIHGSSNVITAGYLAGFNYALGKENTINFNQNFSLNGFNYALGMANLITSNSGYGANYTLGAANTIEYTGPSGDDGSAGLNFIVGNSNNIEVDQTSLTEYGGVGANFITGAACKILGESVGSFQNGIFLSSSNTLGAFTFGVGDFVNQTHLVNNYSQSLMVGFGTQPTFFVQDNHVGINTTSVNHAALRITTNDGTHTKLDIQAAGDEGWQNQIRFMDNSGNFRHLIVDDFESNNLVIMPGYWNDGDPVANRKLNIEGSTEIYDDCIVRGTLSVVSSSGNEFKVFNNGNVRAREVQVDLQNIPDYVFNEDYKLLSIDRLKEFVTEKKHLPNIPSEKEYCEKGGIMIGELNVKLLEKVEELTLYILQLHSRIKTLEDEK